MILKTKIYTTSDPEWVKDNLPYIQQQLGKAKNLVVEDIVVERIKLDNMPTIKNGDGDNIPDWSWLKKNIFESGYNAVCVHISSTERRKFDLAAKYGGYYNWENDDVIECYITVNKSRNNAYGYDFDNFTRIFIHELCHGFDVWTHGKPNINVHHWDYDLKKIHELPAEYDFNRMPILVTVNLMKALLIKIIERLTMKLAILEKPQSLLHPVEEYKNSITQDYGVKTPISTLTGRHIGCDYATPSNTPVRAPWDGAVTVTGYSATLGNFCHYQYTRQGQKYTDRYLHLKESPKAGLYKRGNIVGRTGNTGKSQGYHIHLDIWIGDVDLTNINKINWSAVTVDPKNHYV